MWYIRKKFTLPIGHRLLKHSGKCHWTHGHNFSIYIQISCEKLDSNDNVEQTITNFLGPNWFSKTDKFGSWMRLFWK